MSIANREGIQTFDLKKAPLSRETLEAIRDGELLIHNAAFELRWFGRHFGFIPKNVFCTLTADRLLIPSKKIRHRLEDVLDRRLGIVIDKEIDHKAWGADVLTQEQLDYARIDAEHLHTLAKILKAEITAANLDRIFQLESDLLPIVAKMELHGFAVSTDRMQKIKAREDEVCERLEAEIRGDFGDPELNVNAPGQLLEAFKKSGTELKSTAEESLIEPSIPAEPKFWNTGEPRSFRVPSRVSWPTFATGDCTRISIHWERFTADSQARTRTCKTSIAANSASVSSPPGRVRFHLRGLFPDRASRRGSDCPGRGDDCRSQAGRGSAS